MSEGGVGGSIKAGGLAVSPFVLVLSLLSCGPVNTQSCKIVLDKKQQYELLERLRPLVEAKSSNGRTYPFEVQLERYEPVFRECSNFYEVKFEAIANPTPTTVFTGSDEQYLIYKTGNQVVGPLVFR